jgi:hypothetical protein
LEGAKDQELNGIQKKVSLGKPIEILTKLEFPIEELGVHLLKKGNGESLLDIHNITENEKDRIASVVEKVIYDESKKQKAAVKIKSVKWIFNDSDGLLGGNAHFDVVLAGRRNELKKIADVDQVLFYEWED